MPPQVHQDRGMELDNSDIHVTFCMTTFDTLLKSWSAKRRYQEKRFPREHIVSRSLRFALDLLLAASPAPMAPAGVAQAARKEETKRATFKCSNARNAPSSTEATRSQASYKGQQSRGIITGRRYNWPVCNPGGRVGEGPWD